MHVTYSQDIIPLRFISFIAFSSFSAAYNVPAFEMAIFSFIIKPENASHPLVIQLYIYSPNISIYGQEKCFLVSLCFQLILFVYLELHFLNSSSYS